MLYVAIEYAGGDVGNTESSVYASSMLIPIDLIFDYI